ncbi:ubiquitin-protein ligase E3A [Aplysia californica]|uniref:HECT-type E3 ubiquitin transferase n=1 Tax=Aplysia californica TaxID=6500 RepID=A0ABM0JV41_APLCA|nr:ubiquitin-protein ligase E3A [Aplysia californica]
MSSSNTNSSLDGQQSASDLSVENLINRRLSPPPENMKRAAAKQLIEQYYYQLTEGCGDENCTNENCASSSDFQFRDANRNKLALEAINLSKSKAPLCERRPNKLSRYPTQEEGAASSSTAASAGEPVGQGARSKIASPTSCSSSTDVAAEAVSACSSSSSLGTATQFLTEEILTKVIDECEARNSWSKLNHVIGSVFNNPESILLSFRKASPASEPVVDEAAATDESSATTSQASDGDSSGSNLPVPESQSGPASTDKVTTDGHHDDDMSVDLPSLRRAYQRLLDVPDQPFQGALVNALMILSHTLDMELKYKDALARRPDYINVFVIVMEIPMLHWPEYLVNAFPCLCRALGSMPLSGQARLARIWATYGSGRLQEMVQGLQQMITVKVINNEGRWSQSFQPGDDMSITSATRVLKVIYYASVLGGHMDSPELLREEAELSQRESIQEHMQGAFGMEPKDSTPPKEDPLGKELGVQVINCREPLVPFEDFINEPLNDTVNIYQDYTNNKFSFVPYSFILTTASKHSSMYYENRIRMLSERRTAFIQTLVSGGPPNPFLRVRVRREHIIDDALVSLEMTAMENPSDLRKQLFVEFEGEQGLDEGGVSKEFFQLIVEELFNPDIGMFAYNEESHHFWFNSLSFENDAQFTLIGILLGLAIYNSCILDIHFPMVVYRKLMGKKGTFADLYDLDPTLMHSLQDMLDYEGEDFEDVFAQSFSIGYHDVFGHCHTVELKEGGESLPLTQDNKHEFIKLYADYLLNKSIERQFLAFKRGFLMVTSESPLRQLFRPEEIEVLVCGSKILDFHALEEATEYDGGFTQESQTIRNFWTVVHDMEETEKKKLLQFTTGTDRVPVGGLSHLKMIIAKNGPDSDRLPTSHTCFNVLLLPEYPSVEKLKDRLLKAINYSKGFGML